LRIGKVYSIDNPDDGSFNRHVLIADRGARGFAVGAHDHFARAGAQSISDDNDVLGWFAIQIVRMNDQKAYAFQVGRLLRGPNCADDFS
jgi:hypothetical protein